MKHKMPDSKLS